MARNKLTDNEYKELQSSWSDYQNSRNEKFDKLDKIVFGLATGSFALSITFINSIAGDHFSTNDFKWVMMSAWILFLLTIIFHFISFIVAISQDKKKMDAISNAIESDDNSIIHTNDSILRKMDKYTVMFNYFCLGSYITGLILLLTFAILNNSIKEDLKCQNKNKVIPLVQLVNQ